MNKLNCKICGRKLNHSEINKKATVCNQYYGKARVEKIQTEEFLRQNFTKKWSADLFESYVLYLKELGIGVDTIRKHSSKVLKVFQKAEKELLRPSDFDELWLVSTLEEITNSMNIKLSLFSLLTKKGYLSLNQDEGTIASIKRLIEQVPIGFRRLLEIFQRKNGT